MSKAFLVAPDFSPECLGGWYLLTTLLQKRAHIPLHLNAALTHDEQSHALDTGKVAVVYANPFDAANLIREKGYMAVARPANKHDEMVVIGAKSAIAAIDELKKGVKVAITDNFDVKMVGLRLLESVDLTEQDLGLEVMPTHQGAVRAVLDGHAQAAFLMKSVYDSLSARTKNALCVLIQSDISAISHVLLIKQDETDKDAITKVLLDLHKDEDGKSVLLELGFDEGFVKMSEEEAEFMIDLMDTLVS